MSLTMARSTSWARPISTTTPLGSSASAMKAASITKVAPCSPWAGPNISPRNEWATITWSRTSTANIGPPEHLPANWLAAFLEKCDQADVLRGRIVDQLAQYAALGAENTGQSRRQVVERDGGRQQRIEPRIRQEVERGGEPAAMRPARPMRGRDLPDLARHQPEAAAVERAAERDRDLAGAVPAHFQHRRLGAGEPDRGREPGRAPARMDHEIAIARRGVRRRKADAKGAGERRARRIDIDERHLGAGQPPAQPPRQRPHHPGPDHRDAVGRPGRGVP